ncbi:MAG: ABC transporter substrate-binding protein [Armatimonadota bacterium]|nr:ABC transporter substrate-binding protein [Armatimonadota bacterium]
MLRRNLVGSLLLALLVAGSLMLGTPVPGRGQIPNTVLVVGANIDDAVSLDPAQAFEFTSVWVVDQIYDTLVDFNRDLTRAVPSLARSWTVSDGGKTYTFRLRPGVRFHSGAPVDARAVEFSIRRAHRLKMAPSFIITDFIARPEDVVAVSPDTVRVTFNQTMPDVLMASVLSNPVTGVVDPALVQRNATADDPMANKWLTENSAGSGPYRLHSWRRNVRIELEAVSGHWRGTPRLRRFIYLGMPEPTAQLLALQRGDIDVATDLLPRQFRELERARGIVVRSTPAFQVRYLAMNAQTEPFTRVPVRTALKWAIDYDAIRGIFEGATDMGQTIVPARMFGHLADRPYRRDPARARALLREAGLEGGFRTELLVGTDPPLPDVAAKIKEDLAAVNVQAEVRVLRSADLLGIYRGQRHQMVIARWGADYPDPDNLAKAFADFDARVLAWRNRWDHPVKRLVQQAVAELDPAKRKALYEQIQKVVLEEGPYVILGYPLNQMALRSNVKNFEPSPLFAMTELFDAYKE